MAQLIPIRFGQEGVYMTLSVPVDEIGAFFDILNLNNPSNIFYGITVEGNMSLERPKEVEIPKEEPKEKKEK